MGEYCRRTIDWVSAFGKFFTAQDVCELLLTFLQAKEARSGWSIIQAPHVLKMKRSPIYLVGVRLTYQTTGNNPDDVHKLVSEFYALLDTKDLVVHWSTMAAMHRPFLIISDRTPISPPDRRQPVNRSRPRRITRQVGRRVQFSGEGIIV